jgi:hypothetical protein
MKKNINGTAYFFTFSFIIEGAAEKVLQIIMSMNSIYNKNFHFNEEKCIFEPYGKVKNIRFFKIILFFKICSAYLFRAALYKFTLYYIKMCCSISE